MSQTGAGDEKKKKRSMFMWFMRNFAGIIKVHVGAGMGRMLAYSRCM